VLNLLSILSIDFFVVSITTKGTQKKRKKDKREMFRSRFLQNKRLIKSSLIVEPEGRL